MTLTVLNVLTFRARWRWLVSFTPGHFTFLWSSPRETTHWLAFWVSRLTWRVPFCNRTTVSQHITMNLRFIPSGLRLVKTFKWRKASTHNCHVCVLVQLAQCTVVIRAQITWLCASLLCCIVDGYCWYVVDRHCFFFFCKIVVRIACKSKLIPLCWVLAFL